MKWCIAFILYAGFNKIIKKYNKTFGENNLKNWLPNIDLQPFVTSPDCDQLLDIVTSLINEDACIEEASARSESLKRKQLKRKQANEAGYTLIDLSSASSAAAERDGGGDVGDERDVSQGASKRKRRKRGNYLSVTNKFLYLMLTCT
jgi:hypothetical protein